MDEKLISLDPKDREVIEAFLTSLEADIDDIYQNLEVQDDLEQTTIASVEIPEEDLGDFNVALSSEHEMCGGAPHPIMMAGEHILAIAFYLSSDSESRPSAIFKLEGVNSFEKKDNVGGYEHNCVFPPFSYDNVWERLKKTGEKELVFGFHDTSFRVICRSSSYVVKPSDQVLETIAEYFFEA